MRFAFILVEKAHFPVAKLCSVLGVSRAGFYAWRERPRSPHRLQDDKLKVLVQDAHERSRKTYGSPRVHRALQKQDVRVSRKRIIRLMQEGKLVARVRRRCRCTTMSAHEQPVAANILDRRSEAAAPNQRWAGETTELITPSGKLYLAVILGLISRFVVGWSVSALNDRYLTVKALEMAVRRRCLQAGLLHHSDRGSRYAREDYRSALEAHAMTCSMSRQGSNCYDNTAMESWFSTLKSELGEYFASAGEAKHQLFDSIEVFYNHQRMHSSIGYASPAEFERAQRLAQVA